MQRDNQFENLWQRLRGAVFPHAPEEDPRAAPVEPLRHLFDTPETSPRILLLTSELGCGHARAAQAIRLAILQRMPATVCLFDWWSLMHPSVAQGAKQMYLELVLKHPDLYERIYHLGEGTWRELLSGARPMPAPVQQLCDLIRALHLGDSLPPAHGPYASDRALFSLFCSTPADPQSLIAGGMLAKLALMKWSWGRLVRRMRMQIRKFQPDVIVATQMIPAALVSAIKTAAIKQHRRLSIPSVAVPTDFGVHDFWNQPGTDWYCLGHESLSELPSTLDPARVIVTGIPLMPEFASPIDGLEARRRLELREDVPVVLILGGGLGLGVETVAERLLRGNINATLLVLRGQNASAGAKLDALAAQNASRLRVYDWTDRVDVFVRAADIVVGKPGGLSVAEVLACGRPLFATRSLQGQEGFNVRFLERHGVGRLLSEEELVASIDTLLANSEELAALKERAWQLGCRDGADGIADRTLALAFASSARAGRSRGWQLNRSH